MLLANLRMESKDAKSKILTTTFWLLDFFMMSVAALSALITSRHANITFAPIKKTFFKFSIMGSCLRKKFLSKSILILI